MSSQNVTVDVVTSDIDRMGHVNNSVYLRWIEDAVYRHWTTNATSSEKESYEWIAVRHEIDYRLPAYRGDHLIVTTRLQSVRRARAWYETQIVRDGKTVVEAKSCWCCIDALTHRLVPVPLATAARFLGCGAERATPA